jgi:DNA-binding winged helix-turn-helix (wHTH) protein
MTIGPIRGNGERVLSWWRIPSPLNPLFAWGDRSRSVPRTAMLCSAHILRSLLPVDLRTRLICFGDFEVDVVSGELRKQGLRIKLQEQPFQALVALIERPQEVLTREELQKRLWPGNTVVDFDRGLNKAINRLREALGDDADNPRFIETLPQRGYRFLVSVDHPEVQLQPPPEISQSNPANQAPLDLFRIQRRRLFLVAGGGLIGLPLIPVAYRFFHHPSDEIQSIAVLPLVNLSGDPDQEYFSDGMTDELIGGLARISSLRSLRGHRSCNLRERGLDRSRRSHAN